MCPVYYQTFYNIRVTLYSCDPSHLIFQKIKVKSSLKNDYVEKKKIMPLNQGT